ncbi:MAG TPA: YjfB family protein [Holophagaceae bacterium]
MQISAAAAQGMNQAPNAASVAVLRKALDITAQQGAGLVAMIDQTSVPPAPGVGQNLNIQA